MADSPPLSVATRQHVCRQCGQVIAVGEAYVRWRTLRTHQWDTVKVHAGCLAAWQGQDATLQYLAAPVVVPAHVAQSLEFRRLEALTPRVRDEDAAGADPRQVSREYFDVARQLLAAGAAVRKGQA